MKKERVKIKSIIKFIVESWKNPQKKAIFMLIIMFIFFTFLSISLRSNHHNIKNNNYEEVEDNLDFNLSKIKDKNYHYRYTLNIDNTNLVYEGDKYNDKELFNINNIDMYYKYGNIYLKNVNGIWSTLNEQLSFSEFIDVDVIEELINKGSFESKTEYSNNKKIYNYNISTSTIIEIIDEVNIDIDDIPNKINIATDSDNNVIQISYDLSSYSKYRKLGNNVIANIDYSLFGKINEIEDPN